MLVSIIISIAITLIAALTLIFTQRPAAMPPGDGLDFTQTLDGASTDLLPLSAITMRDGFPLQVRRVPADVPDAPLLILVHGSGWHGQHFDWLATQFSGTADVIAPDLRGHGVSPGRRGDIDYFDQFEDDLADLIKATAKPGQKVVLGGHSSGGGLVVRFAGGPYGDQLDGAVLLAPFLHHRAATTRQNSGGWTQVLLRRIIGLSILNTFQIRALNHLPIIQFRMPKAVMDGPFGHTATTSYSYRLNTGFAPRGKALKDIAALPPFILIVGREDEAFHAPNYAPLMSAHTDNGTYVIVDGVSHLPIVAAPETQTLIEEFLRDL